MLLYFSEDKCQILQNVRETISWLIFTYCVLYFTTKICVCCVHEQSAKFISFKKGLDVMRSHALCRTCFDQYQAHQLHWGDWEMETASSCTEWSQMAGLIHKVGRGSSKASSLHAAVLCAGVSFKDHT